MRRWGKPLDPPPPIGLRHIDVAVRVDGQGMTVDETPELMSRAAETRQDLSALMLEDMDGLVAPVHHVHVLLLRVARKRCPPGRAARVRQSRRSRPDPDAGASHLKMKL